MPTFDWTEVIPETLRDVYYEIRGEAPEGNLEPSQELIASLLAHFRGKPSEVIVDFLKDSMYAHLAKTQRTRGPFYVKDLLAKKNLDYLSKNGSNLREFYSQKIEPLQFTRTVYGAVYSTELDYLEVIGGLWMRDKKTIMWNLLSPSAYWLIFSEYWGRLNTSEIDAWDQTTVEYAGRDVLLSQAHTKERKLMGDSVRFAYARETANDAIRDATIDWASRLNFVHTATTNDGKILLLPDSEMPRDLIEVKKPLLDRDKALFEWARLTTEARAKNEEAVGHAAAVRVLEPVEQRPPPVLQKLTPVVAALQHDLHSDK